MKKLIAVALTLTFASSSLLALPTTATYVPTSREQMIRA